MKSLLEFMVVFTVAILPHLVGAIFILTNRDYLKNLPPWQRTISSWVRDIGKILVLVYVAMDPDNGLGSIGLGISGSQLSQVFFVAVFITGYLSLIFVVQKLRSMKAQGKRQALRKAIFEAGGFSSYKGLWERCAYLTALWMGVIAEDLVFRGYLVLGLGSRFGFMPVWIALSIVLSVLVHLYQGWNKQVILSQAFFAIIFIIAAVTTNSVLTAIVPHLVYDTIWILQGWAKASSEVMEQPASPE